MRHHDPLIGTREVVHHFASDLVENDGADGHLQHDVVALTAGLVRAFAVASALGLVFGIEAEVHQRVVALAGFHDDVAAAARRRRPTVRRGARTSRAGRPCSRCRRRPPSPGFWLRQRTSENSGQWIVVSGCAARSSLRHSLFAWTLHACHPDRGLQPEWRDLRLAAATKKPRRNEALSESCHLRSYNQCACEPVASC